MHTLRAGPAFGKWVGIEQLQTQAPGVESSECAANLDGVNRPIH